MSAKRILIVEDAPQVANILVSKLTREGHAPVWARDRAQALARLPEGFDLILLSTDLPEKNAWELLAQIKPASPAPILMLLETDEAALEARAAASGACGVIVKPFKPTVVAKLVKKTLGL